MCIHDPSYVRVHKYPPPHMTHVSSSSYDTHVSSSSSDTHVSSSSYDTRVSSSSYDTHIYRTLQLSLPHLQIMAMSEALKKWFTLKPGGLNLGQKFTDLIHKDDIQRLVHLVTCPPPALSSGHRQDISLRLVKYPNVLLMCF